MSDKPTGVFVRLPLSEEAASVMRNHIMSQILTTNALAHTLLAIGTPVTGGDIPIAGFIAPKQAEKAILGTASPMTLQPRGSGGRRYTVALVRQSDAQAQIAALEAEVVRLRHYLERIDSLIMGNSDPVMMFCGIHASCTEALKGGAA